jgi:hypothetical protein
MAENQPVRVVGGYFYAFQDTVDAQYGIVKDLGGTVHGLIPDGLAGLQEEEAYGRYEDNTGHSGHNDIEAAGERSPEEVKIEIHGSYRAEMCS